MWYGEPMKQVREKKKDIEENRVWEGKRLNKTLEKEECEWVLKSNAFTDSKYAKCRCSPASRVLYYIVPYYLKRVKTSWTLRAIGELTIHIT